MFPCPRGLDNRSYACFRVHALMSTSDKTKTKKKERNKQQKQKRAKTENTKKIQSQNHHNENHQPSNDFGCPPAPIAKIQCFLMWVSTIFAIGVFFLGGRCSLSWSGFVFNLRSPRHVSIWHSSTAFQPCCVTPDSIIMPPPVEVARTTQVHPRRGAKHPNHSKNQVEKYNTCIQNMQNQVEKYLKST